MKLEAFYYKNLFNPIDFNDLTIWITPVPDCAPDLGLNSRNAARRPNFTGEYMGSRDAKYYDFGVMITIFSPLLRYYDRALNNYDIHASR